MFAVKPAQKALNPIRSIMHSFPKEVVFTLNIHDLSCQNKKNPSHYNGKTGACIGTLPPCGEPVELYQTLSKKCELVMEGLHYMIII